MPPIRVLIADDSALARQMLTRALSTDPRIEVVGTAKDGVEAVQRVRELRPDVVSLDVTMPEMDGIEALRHIMRDSDARVVMLSSLDDPETTYAALGAGAVDFVPKPRGGFASSIEELGRQLGRAIKIAYVIPADKRQTTSPWTAPVPGDPGMPASRGRGGDPSRLVVMAASTGGPPALERVFAGLSGDVPAAYLVVQHLPGGFTSSFANRLGRAAGFPVVEAREGMRVQAGRGYVAPHGSHMVIAHQNDGTTQALLSDGPAMHGVRPAADPLFESAVDAFGPHVTGVVLTGMGVDGARGLLAVSEAGGATIAQDEATSVVWGMPGAAVRLDAAKVVAPLGRIAAEIRRTLREAEAGSV